MTFCCVVLLHILMATSGGDATAVFTYVFLWYICAVMAVTLSRAIMIQFPHPYILTFSQFCTAMVTTVAVSLWKGASLKSLFVCNKYVLVIGLTYTFGFICTNVAYSLSNPSFVETVKAAEPISSVALEYIFFYEYISWTTYSTLIPICTGVAMACLGGQKHSFHVIGFMITVVANVCFSGRSVVAKQLFKREGSTSVTSDEIASPDVEVNMNAPSSSQLKELQQVLLFAQVSLIGCVVLLFVVLTLDGEVVYSMYAACSSRIRTSETAENALLSNRSCSIDSGIVGMWLLNGIAYTAYNLCSFLVLQETSVATHAVLNAGRRVVVILSTCLLFSTTFGIFQICGLVLAVCGVMAYAMSASAGGDVYTGLGCSSCVTLCNYCGNSDGGGGESSSYLVNTA